MKFWSVSSGLFYLPYIQLQRMHSTLPSIKSTRIDELNFEGLNFSVTIDKISKFEKQHPGISVTVIGIAKDKK